jgi:DNA sulfur modification protein DndC
MITSQLDSLATMYCVKSSKSLLFSLNTCSKVELFAPTSSYIQEQVKRNGEVIILLGTREGESSARKKSLQKHSIGNSRLNRHSDLQSAYTYKPIRYMTTDDVWIYLLETSSPWAGSNNELVALYRKASGGDCPLVIDNTTPPCGQSRFGCWVCTVVNKDKSMQSLIDSGERHLKPLINIRNWLVENRSNDKYRTGILRNGGKGKGPYNIQTREFLLTQLLDAERSSKEELITHQELKAIQIIWDRDGYNKNVYEIYYKIYNKRISKENVMSRQDETKKAQDNKIKKICEKYKINADSIFKLLKKEKYKSLNLGRLSMSTEVKEEIERELKK